MTERRIPQNVYCAWAKDLTLRNMCSSGGAFGVLATWFVQNEGVVVGAAYDQEFRVKHVVADCLTDLTALYKSKYVQSELKDTWDEMQKAFDAGKRVLFSGTPCQVAAVTKRYSDYAEQLYTIDILCHGTPEPRIWEMYLDYMQRKWNSGIEQIDLRKKDEYSWQQRKVQIRFQNGNSYISQKGEDPYCRLFLDNVILQQKCYSCPFATVDRVADITLGDFWSLSRETTIADSGKGLSMVLVNSDKGKQLFSMIENQMDIKEMSLSDAVKNNIPMTSAPKPSIYRKTFYKDVEDWGIEWAVNKYLAWKDDREQRLYNFHNFRNMSKLHMRGMKIEDYLKSIGIKEFYLYGYGELGQCLYSDIQDKSMVRGIIDQKFDNEGQNSDGVRTCSPASIPDDSVPIVISCSYQYPEVSLSLIENGIDRLRLYSYAELMRNYLEERKVAERYFLVTGAQFANKGAQAMLYVAVNEIRRRFKNAEIYYLPCVNEKYDVIQRQQYKWQFVSYNELGLNSNFIEKVTRLSAIIDVSGYALSSNWNCERYLQILRMARNYRVPIYLMPQSFGPFSFKACYLQEIRGLLQYADVIFTREMATYKKMQEIFQLDNLRLSEDLVLQSRGIERKNVFADVVKEDLNEEEIPPNAVAVVPNIRNFEFGDTEAILQLYQVAFEFLQRAGKRIYLIPHSARDISFCRKLQERHEMLYMPWEEIDCFTYERIISRFEFVIVSRYHALVHAYKQKVPCVILGWADKYLELARSMDQEKYAFDVRKKPTEETWVKGIESMMEREEQNREKIGSALQKIQMNSCFDCLNDLMRDTDD